MRRIPIHTGKQRNNIARKFVNGLVDDWTQTMALTQITHIYLNVTGNKLVIGSFNFLKASSLYTINLLDAKGNIVLSNKVNTIKGNNSFKINLEGLASGAYMIHIMSADSQKQTLKLIKE
jgi:hypothetical protein